LLRLSPADSASHVLGSYMGTMLRSLRAAAGGAPIYSGGCTAPRRRYGSV